MEPRLVILFNGLEKTESCRFCEKDFACKAGPQVFAQEAMEPAMKTMPVCLPCAGDREPELKVMIELYESFEGFNHNFNRITDGGPETTRK